MKIEKPLNPPTTICSVCFESKRETVKGGVFILCDHNKAGSYLPFHSEPSEKIWITMSPMGVHEYALWKASFAAGFLGETDESKKTTSQINTTKET